jgi:hypothetical protein
MKVAHGKFRAVTFKRSLPLLLAAMLQAMPLARYALPLQSLVAGPSWACVLRLAGAATAMLGACDAVSGASEIYPPYFVDAELGHPYIRVLGTTGSSAYYWSADTTPTDADTFPLAPGLFLTNDTGFIGGVPTQAGTFTATITAWTYSDSFSALFTFTITNGGAPGLFTQPASQNDNVGAAASFAVSAYGALPLTYQWQFDGTAIPGATTNTYSIASLQHSQGGSYNVIVSNKLGHITSSNALLAIETPYVLQPRLLDQSISVSFPAVLGMNYTIKASSDLINWTPRTNITASTISVLFSDPATNSVFFYRAWHP